MNILRFGIGELVALIPTLLDCEPHEVVAAVSIDDSGLPTCALMIPRAVLLDPDAAGATAAAVAEELAVESGRAVLLVSYSEEDLREGCRALDALLLEVEYVVPHVEALAVSGDTWFRPGCFEDGCCPRDLPSVPEPLMDIVLGARKRAAFPTRTSRAPGERAARRRSKREEDVDVWAKALGGGAVPDAQTARRLAASLDDLCVRDWVVLTILGASAQATQDALDGFDSGAVGVALDAAFLGIAEPNPPATALARTVVERVAKAARGKRRLAATQTLVGLVDWWEGNLEAARERCERALAHDDRYRLAELVCIAAQRGIGPGWLARAGQNAL